MDLMRQIRVGDFKIGFEERKAINAVLDCGRISEYKQVREFEKLFAGYVGTKYAVAVSSGTSALIAGMIAILLEETFGVTFSLQIFIVVKIKMKLAVIAYGIIHT